MTMVGLPVQLEQHERPPSVLEEQQRREEERRMARLEDALRIKKEEAAKQAARDIEDLKLAARRKLRTQLLLIDNELDELASADAKGIIKASSWLLEHAYSKYPPQAFNSRKIAEEVNAARALRFRDPTIKALRLLQARYAPGKNDTVHVGAERAVLAEEISKHAFSLLSGINRGDKMATSAMFATSENSADDSHLGAMSSPAWAGDMEDGDDDDVEDAD